MFDWVHKEEPEEMCEMAGFCPAPPAFPRLPPGLQEAAVKLLELQDEDQCNTCQLVIVEASSVLADPVRP